MSRLLDRDEEMHHILDLLVNDVLRLRPQLGVRSLAEENSQDEHAARRHYVRAVFALVEAMVEQHARLLLDLDAHGAIQLDSGVEEVLSPLVYVLDQAGRVCTRDNRQPLKPKIRAVYRAAEHSFGQPLRQGFSDEGWRSFGKALLVRHSLTHPKTMMDCYVDEDALDLVDAAEAWYRGLYNEFVRLMEEHRDVHDW